MYNSTCLFFLIKLDELKQIKIVLITTKNVNMTIYRKYVELIKQSTTSENKLPRD